MSRERGTQKTGGRKPGTPNKTTKEVRRWIFEVVQENTDILEADLKSLEPKERWQIINGLLPYIVTKREPNRTYRWEYSDEDWESMSD